MDLNELITLENKRQQETITLIPSENYISPAVAQMLSASLTNKYSEGFVGKRYYAGNEIVDQVELLAQKKAQQLFNVPYANVQPYSGSIANQIVHLALLEPKDTIMGLSLYDGGHLSTGWKYNFSAKFYNSIPYHVKESGKVDLQEVEKLALKHKPKIIWVGASAYTKIFEFAEFAEIAEKVGAYLAADISHVAGLIAGGAYPSPSQHAHLITTTTHKTLRGPRGATIMITNKGLAKDKDLQSKIEKAIIPGMQGGPHNNTTAAIAQALEEANTSEFKQYSRQVLANAHALAEQLMSYGYKLVGNGTECHLVLLDLTATHSPGAGLLAEYALAKAGITANRNVIPHEPMSPFYPSGLRLGTPAVTTRGMKETEIKLIAQMIHSVLQNTRFCQLPENKTQRSETLNQCKLVTNENKVIEKVAIEVKKLAQSFPAPNTA